MDNSIKNLNQTSNLIDITQDITNRITDDYLVSSERNNITNTNSKKQKKLNFLKMLNIQMLSVGKNIIMKTQLMKILMIFKKMKMIMMRRKKMKRKIKITRKIKRKIILYVLAF